MLLALFIFSGFVKKEWLFLFFCFHLFLFSENRLKCLQTLQFSIKFFCLSLTLLQTIALGDYKHIKVICCLRIISEYCADDTVFYTLIIFTCFIPNKSICKQNQGTKHTRNSKVNSDCLKTYHEWLHVLMLPFTLLS